jgi:glycolate oxidase iron-sulfur subunit
MLGRIAKARPIRWLVPTFALEAMTLLPENPSDRTLPPTSKSGTQARGCVGFVEGCVMPVMFGGTNHASVQLLNQSGYDVETPSGQGCCGALYAHSGQLEKARECARQNIASFEKLNLDAIVINAAGCGSTLKEYGELLADDTDWRERASRFSGQVKDLTEWLETSQFPALDSKLKVTYHDACHLAHPQGITMEPRALVKAVVGDRFIELPEADICCGSAGSYNLTEPEMAERLQQRKINNLLSTGADICVTTNPGCILQIQAGLKKAGSEMRVQHIADFLTGPGE